MAKTPEELLQELGAAKFSLAVGIARGEVAGKLPKGAEFLADMSPKQRAIYDRYAQGAVFRESLPLPLKSFAPPLAFVGGGINEGMKALGLYDTMADVLGEEQFRQGPETSPPSMSNVFALATGAGVPSLRASSQKPIKSYKEGTMAMRSRASYEPGSAEAYQSPYAVGPIGGMGGGMFGYMQSMMERQMRLKEAMAQAQMKTIQMERKAAEQRLKEAEKQSLRKSTMFRKGLAPQAFHKGKQGDARSDMMAKALHVTGHNTPENTRRAQMMIEAIGPQAAHQGMMQSGRIMGSLGQTALGGGYDLARQQARNKGDLALQRQQQQFLMQNPYFIQGGTAEEGGRVPKTGTYKLHKDEIVLNKEQSDMLFPEAPKPAKGKPLKSYLLGTGSMMGAGRGVGMPAQRGRGRGMGGSVPSMPAQRGGSVPSMPAQRGGYGGSGHSGGPGGASMPGQMGGSAPSMPGQMGGSAPSMPGQMGGSAPSTPRGEDYLGGAVGGASGGYGGIALPIPDAVLRACAKLGISPESLMSQASPTVSPWMFGGSSPTPSGGSPIRSYKKGTLSPLEKRLLAEWRSRPHPEIDIDEPVTREDLFMDAPMSGDIPATTTGRVPPYALSPMMDEDLDQRRDLGAVEQFIAHGLGIGQGAEAPTEEVAPPPAPPVAPVAPPMPPPQGQPSALGIEGLSISEEPSGTKKYTLESPPETEEEELARNKADAAYFGRTATYYQSKADAMLEYAGENPGGDIMRMYQERQVIADKYQKRADSAKATVEKMRDQEKAAKTAKELEEIRQGGITDRGGLKAQIEQMEEVRKGIQGTTDSIRNYHRDFLTDKMEGDAFVGSVYEELRPYMPYLEEQLKGQGLMQEEETIQDFLNEALDSAARTGRMDAMAPVFFALDLATGKQRM